MLTLYRIYERSSTEKLYFLSSIFRSALPSIFGRFWRIRRPPVACILRCVDTGLESGLDAGLALEAANYAAIATGPEFHERLQAFLNRRRT